MHKLKKKINIFLVAISLKPYKTIKLNTNVNVNHYKNGAIKVKTI